MSERFKCFMVVLCLFGARGASADPASCTLQIDALVARSGFAQIGASAPMPRTPAASVPAPELALAAAGRLSVGSTNYSVWRIRNSGSDPRSVVLRSAVTVAEARLEVSAHSDLFVRSDDTRGVHTLLVGAAALAAKLPSQSVWRDTRVVSDPLCAEPGTTLWVRRRGAIMRVSPVDRQVLFEIPVADPVSAPFAIDPVDGSLWIYSRSQLRHIDLAGVQQTLPPLDRTGRTVLGRLLLPPPIAVDNAHRLWIGAGRQLLRLSDTGLLAAVAAFPHAILQLSFDHVSGALWVQSEVGVSSWSTADDAVPAAPLSQFPVALLHHVAADIARGGLWVTAANRLRSYDSSGTLREDIALPDAGRYDKLYADAQGGIWLSAFKRFVHCSASGVVDVDATIGAGGPITALSIDDRSGVVWLATSEGLWEYSEAGEALTHASASTGNESAPAPGLVSPLARRIEAMEIFVDRVAPTLLWSTPIAESVLNFQRPDFVVQASDLTGHLDPASFALSVDGASVSLACSGSGGPQFRCAPASDLPQGRLSLVLSAADDSGNISTVQRSLTIDTVAPAIPAASLIQMRSVAGGKVEVNGLAAAVEGRATVMVRNLSSGASGSAVAFSDGSFTLTIAAAAGDSLELKAHDAAGNVGAVLDVVVQSFAASLVLSEPADGIVTSARDLIVRGVLAGAEGGVTVNGRPVDLIGSDGSAAFGTRVSLVSGQNSIDVAAHLPDGTEMHERRTVTLSNPEPFGVRVSTPGGVAPLSASFTVNAYSHLRAKSVEFDFDDDGTVDVRGDPLSDQSFIYTSPGIREAVAIVTGEDGSTYRYRVPLSILSSDTLDQRLRRIWSGFRAALSAPDPSVALSFMEPELAASMSGSVQDLRTALPGIVESFSEPVLTNASSKVAEYIITRQFGSETRAFLIYFRLDADGIWRLAAL